MKSFNVSGSDLIMGLNKEMYYRQGKEIWSLDIIKK